MHEIVSPMVGTVVRIAAAGDVVLPGQEVAVLESMKMEHLVHAPSEPSEHPGFVVAEVAVERGHGVRRDQVLVRLARRTDSGPTPGGGQQQPAEPSGTSLRADLAAVVAAHAHGLDENRPDAVAKRHARGQRTARENVADLCDPGTFTEYGPLVVAAQRARRSLEDLVASTPADGLVTGLGEVAGRPTAVLAYDATVLAGTQGLRNHQKTDRMLEVAEKRRTPVVLFAEGGGGRPGDTDVPVVAALDLDTFYRFARLSGEVPLVGVAAGRCFAGNAALLGCCDVIIATRGANIGMGGPAMIEGGGLGTFTPEEIGPAAEQAAAGVVDVLVQDEAEAVVVAKRCLAYFSGEVAEEWECGDQDELRDLVPEQRGRAFDVRRVVHRLADSGSVLELRRDFGRGIVTALVRVEGRAYGLVANSTEHLGGAVDGEGADKMARFLGLCDRHGLPVITLCDTPGFMVGPESERSGTVRRFGDLFTTSARLRVPLLTVVLRKAYGLGAMAMSGGGHKVPLATVAWPTAEVGAMGLEGAVKLGFRRELEAVADPVERQRFLEEMVELAHEQSKALNAATVFELDDVIDPADTRRWITRVLG
ncbi:carboxyl transferase domain-containing protein [Nocardioides sp. 616]|uniref:carboxyl transferase domain-containing protein n=1 Tax=Nocardioides sp. 616 TaxID=2268090 RepID=UPI001962A602|nr:carboxyl transferase domain-containing protein [Nocardioides sp. 616]